MTANQIGVHRSTICRELQRSIVLRGRTSGKYLAANAGRKIRYRHKHKRKRVLLACDLKQETAFKMKQDKWSHELIAKKWKQLGIPVVSHETIYKWIWESEHTNRLENFSYKELYKKLKHGKRRQKRRNIKDPRGVIKNPVHITKRPDIVEH